MSLPDKAIIEQVNDIDVVYLFIINNYYNYIHRNWRHNGVKAKCLR